MLTESTTYCVIVAAHGKDRISMHPLFFPYLHTAVSPLKNMTVQAMSE